VEDFDGGEASAAERFELIGAAALGVFLLDVVGEFGPAERAGFVQDQFCRG